MTLTMKKIPPVPLQVQVQVLRVKEFYETVLTKLRKWESRSRLFQGSRNWDSWLRIGHARSVDIFDIVLCRLMYSSSRSSWQPPKAPPTSWRFCRHRYVPREVGEFVRFRHNNLFKVKVEISINWAPMPELSSLIPESPALSNSRQGHWGSWVSRDVCKRTGSI